MDHDRTKHHPDSAIDQVLYLEHVGGILTNARPGIASTLAGAFEFDLDNPAHQAFIGTVAKYASAAAELDKMLNELNAERV